MSKVYVYNPLNEDFTVKYDIRGNKNPKAFTLKAKEIAQFDRVIANHLKKHLANKMFDLLGDVTKDRDIQMENFYKQMEVKI
jgi:hypothetical protein